MRLSESHVPVPVLESKDYGSAGSDFASVHIGRTHGLSVFISFGSLTGNSILTVYTGATRTTKTTAMAFKYRIGGGAFNAASADILGDATSVTSAGLTLTAATFQHKLIAIEIDVDAMTDAQPWVTLSVDSTATVLNMAAIAVAKPRHASHTTLTLVR